MPEPQPISSPPGPLPITKTEAKCLQKGCRFKRTGSRLATEIKAIRHHTDTGHHVAVHTPNYSLVFTENGTTRVREHATDAERQASLFGDLHSR